MRKVAKLSYVIGIIKTNYKGWTWTLARRVTYIYCMFEFMVNFKKTEKGEPYILETRQYSYPCIVRWN